MKMYY